MDNFSRFDKINIPMYICDKDWTVVFRNASCKKYTSSPRRGVCLKGRFVDGELTAFPEDKDGMFFVSLLIKDTYKTGICFGYRGYALILFPSIIEFDILFADVMKNQGEAFAEQIRFLLDNVFSENTAEGEGCFRVIEKLRKTVYSSIESYVALAAFDSEKRVPASFMQIYGFLTEGFVRVANKAGFKVVADLSPIAELGDTVYTDTMYFSATLASLMLFCLEISYDNKCLVVPQHLGDVMRNTIKFKLRKEALGNVTGGFLCELARVYPAEYLNLLPIDQLCSALGWETVFELSDKEELNCSVKMDISIDNRLIFKSAGNAPMHSYEDIISDILSVIVFPK